MDIQGEAEVLLHTVMTLLEQIRSFDGQDIIVVDSRKNEYSSGIRFMPQSGLVVVYDHDEYWDSDGNPKSESGIPAINPP